jgi:hypothetical protein
MCGSVAARCDGCLVYMYTGIHTYAMEYCPWASRYLLCSPSIDSWEQHRRPVADRSHVHDVYVKQSYIYAIMDVSIHGIMHVLLISR